MSETKLKIQQSIALLILIIVTGASAFSNFEIKRTQSEIERHEDAIEKLNLFNEAGNALYEYITEFDTTLVQLDHELDEKVDNALMTELEANITLRALMKGHFKAMMDHRFEFYRKLTVGGGVEELNNLSSGFADFLVTRNGTEFYVVFYWINPDYNTTGPAFENVYEYFPNEVITLQFYIDYFELTYAHTEAIIIEFFEDAIVPFTIATSFLLDEYTYDNHGKPLSDAKSLLTGYLFVLGLNEFAVLLVNKGVIDTEKRKKDWFYWTTTVLSVIVTGIVGYRIVMMFFF